MSYLFGIGTTRQKNVGSGVLNFSQWPEKTGLAHWVGQPGNKMHRFLTIFISETPAQIGCEYFVILCNFEGGCILRAPGVPAYRLKIKTWTWDFLHKSKV